MGATSRTGSESETSGYQERKCDLVSITVEPKNCCRSPGERETGPAGVCLLGLLQLQGEGECETGCLGNSVDMFTKRRAEPSIEALAGSGLSTTDLLSPVVRGESFCQLSRGVAGCPLESP